MRDCRLRFPTKCLLSGSCIRYWNGEVGRQADKAERPKLAVSFQMLKLRFGGSPVGRRDLVPLVGHGASISAGEYIFYSDCRSESKVIPDRAPVRYEVFDDLLAIREAAEVKRTRTRQIQSIGRRAEAIHSKTTMQTLLRPPGLWPALRGIRCANVDPNALDLSREADVASCDRTVDTARGK
jgi:hypothetical protein